MSEPDRTPLISAEDVRQLERLRLGHLDAILQAVAGQPVGRPGARGLDFAEYRPYAAGDDVRLIDANVYARLRQAFVKTSPAEEDHALTILLDGSRSIGTPGLPSRHHADRLAALVGTIGLLRGDAVHLTVLADGSAESGAPLVGAPAIGDLVDQLARLPRGTHTDLAAAIRYRRRWHPVCDLAVLVTDALVEPDALEDAVAELRRAGRSAAVLHVVETQPGALRADGAAALRDSETGEELVVDVGARLRATYAERARELAERVVRICVDAGVGCSTMAVEGEALDQLLDLAGRQEIVAVAGAR